MNYSTVKSPLRRDILVPAGLALLAVVLRLVPGPRIIDDAYITYRYARNIIRGVGFVYNPNQYVLGTTTPLYTLALAVLGAVTGSAALPQVSVMLNALADGASVALLYFLGRRLLDHWLAGAVLGALWAVAPRSVTFAIGGMETSVFIAWMLGALLAWIAGRTRLSAGLSALSVLTRPDALIWAGPLGVAMIIGHWRDHPTKPTLGKLPWMEGLIFLGILLPWLIYGTLRFGSPLTRSIAAKEAAYQIPPLNALVIFLQHYATPFFEDRTLGPTGAEIGSVLYLTLSLVGAMFLIRRDWRAAPLVVFPWLYFIVFAWANPLVFRWYLAPPMPIYFLCIVAGLWGLAHQIIGNNGKWVVAVVGAGWLALSLAAWQHHPDHGPDRPAPEMAWLELEILYHEAALRVLPLVEDDTVIAAGDIGALGWYSDATVLDTLGLVSPEATHFYPLPASMLATAPYAVAPDLIIEQQPDFIIILETYGRNGLLKDGRFLERYRLREVIETDIYDSEGMLIFERADR